MTQDYAYGGLRVRKGLLALFHGDLYVTVTKYIVTVVIF